MEAYTCAYRDPNSPLTPLSPINEAIFKYDLKSTLMASKNINETVIQNICDMVKKDQELKQEKRKGELKLPLIRVQFNISPRPICAKVEKLLKNIGLLKYKQLFEKEEIDYEVFQFLTDYDLKNIGVLPINDRQAILKEVQNIRKF